MRKIQIAISLDPSITLTWNLTGSCGRQQKLRGWSRMVVKHFQDGGQPPFWKSLYRHISVISSDFHEILYVGEDFELDERHMIENEKVALDRLRVRQNVFLVQINTYCFDTASPYHHEATSEMWCWSGGRGILTELCLCATVLCIVIMVHNSSSSSWMSVNWIGLQSCLV